MTRIEIKKIIKVLIAYAEGKALQAKPIGSKDSRWEDVTEDCDFHNPFWEFRVKPEPKLVPFTFEDAPLFRDKWVKHINNGIPTRITEYSQHAIHVSTHNAFTFTYMEFLRLFVFVDTGEPCGKLAEE